MNLPEGFVLDEQPGTNPHEDEEYFSPEGLLFFWVLCFVLVWVVSALVRQSWRSTICHYIAEPFRYGGKQMLCDIIKWTIIIIIAAVVFGITYRIATNGPSTSGVWGQT